MADWKKLLNSTRRKSMARSVAGEATPSELRTEIERDYDRILFSTPVRRLADKTQVFPLERHDSVRNRLTHSHEVANLARSIGTSLVWHDKVAKNVEGYERDIPAMLAAVGLAHDLGNPPFGHQGEVAIQSWYKAKLEKCCKAFQGLDESQKKDFLNFDGNAQTFRLVTRLQLIDHEYGLDLTYGTLAALLKYPCDAGAVNENNAATKKSGIFQSEISIANEVWEQVGLEQGRRHPLTFIMEACDDIAYSVLDVEDAVKKQIVSFFDVLEYLDHEAGQEEGIQSLTSQARKKHVQYRDRGLSPLELNDVSTQRFRVFLIGKMITDVRAAFVSNQAVIERGDLATSIIDASSSARLYELLKRFAYENAYLSRSVKELELTGHRVIHGIMDFIWQAIATFEPRKSGDTPKEPFAAYIYSRISENYRRIFEDKNSSMPWNYRRLQLVSDMVSGMTDSFAIDFYKDLEDRSGLKALQ